MNDHLITTYKYRMVNLTHTWCRTLAEVCKPMYHIIYIRDLMQSYIISACLRCTHVGEYICKIMTKCLIIRVYWAQMHPRDGSVEFPELRV